MPGENDIVNDVNEAKVFINSTFFVFVLEKNALVNYCFYLVIEFCYLLGL